MNPPEPSAELEVLSPPGAFDTSAGDLALNLKFEMMTGATGESRICPVRLDQLQRLNIATDGGKCYRYRGIGRMS